MNQSRCVKRLTNGESGSYGPKGAGGAQTQIVDHGLHAQTASVQSGILMDSVMEEVFGGGKLEELLLRSVGREHIEKVVRDRVDRAIAIKRAEVAVSLLPSADVARGNKAYITFMAASDQKDLLDAVSAKSGRTLAATVRDIVALGLRVLTDWEHGGEETVREVVVPAPGGVGSDRVRVQRVGGAG